LTSQKPHLALGVQHVISDRVILRLHIARQGGQLGAREFARGFLQLALLAGQVKIYVSASFPAWRRAAFVKASPIAPPARKTTQERERSRKRANPLFRLAKRRHPGEQAACRS
jgi:hypothetical protein